MSRSLFPALQEEGYLLFAVLACILLIYLLSCKTSQRSRKVVVNWPVVGMLPTIIANSRRLLDHITSVLREFDSSTLMFRGPWFCKMDYLLTCSPDNANHMFNLHFTNYPKGKLFSMIFEVLGDGIFNVDGDLWRDQRRIAQAHRNTQRFRSSVEECTRNKVSEVLLPLLKTMADSDTAVDLNNVFMRFTFDTTCALAIGVDPGCLAFEFPTIPFATAVDEIEDALVFRYIAPTFWWQLLRWLRVGKEKKFVAAREVGEGFINKCIRERRERTKSIDKEVHLDMMAPYMDRDDKFLRDTLLTFLLAGKDTVGVALTWLFWLLSNNPSVEKKILEELRKLRPFSELRNDEMTVFEAEEINELVYLHATLFESLRLYPPVPFSQKEAQKADILPSGHRVLPGTKIIFSMYSMGRMETVWGEDCLEFKPERWITEKGTLKHEPSYKFIAFHSGPRTCLGKNMTTQMKLIAAAMIYNFNVKVVDGHVVVPKIAIVIKPEKGLPVKLRKRKYNGY